MSEIPFTQSNLQSCIRKGIRIAKQVDTIKTLLDEYQEIKNPMTQEYREPVDGEKLRQAVDEIGLNLLKDLKARYNDADYEICTGFDSAHTAAVKKAIDEAIENFELDRADTRIYLDRILSKIQTYP